MLCWKSVGSQSVRGPGPARRYDMQGLARWLHAWRWRNAKVPGLTPTSRGALLFRWRDVICIRSILVLTTGLSLNVTYTLYCGKYRIILHKMNENNLLAIGYLPYCPCLRSSVRRTPRLSRFWVAASKSEPNWAKAATSRYWAKSSFMEPATWWPTQEKKFHNYCGNKTSPPITVKKSCVCIP